MMFETDRGATGTLVVSQATPGQRISFGCQSTVRRILIRLTTSSPMTCGSAEFTEPRLCPRGSKPRNSLQKWRAS